MKTISLSVSAPVCSLALAAVFAPGLASAQVQWSLPSAGSYLTGSNWTGGNVPTSTQDATVNVANAIVQIGAGNLVTNDTFLVTNGRLEMTGGTLLSTDRLRINGANGRIAISNGEATVRALQIESGGNAVISGGTVSAIVDVRAVTNGTIDVTGGTLIAGKVVASGNLTASGTALVTMEQPTVTTNFNELWIGTTGAGATVTLKNSAQWLHKSTAASAANVVVGRGNIGTLLIQDNAVFSSTGAEGFTAKVIQVGTADGGTGKGTVQVNGGTITALGFNRATATGVIGVINANGGTFKAAGTSTNYFANFTGTGGDNSVNLLTGGMTFDTGGNDVTIATGLVGEGGLTKTGAGVLTLSGNNTYIGTTAVTGGEVLMSGATLGDASAVSVADGAILNLAHGLRDSVGSLTLGGVTHLSGTFGSPESPATNKSNHFKGTGILYVGTPPAARDLVWTGAVSGNWSINGDANFTFNGTPTSFDFGDRVTFSNTSSTPVVVTLTGSVQVGGITFAGTADHKIIGTGFGIAGTGGIVMNNPNFVTLGGETSSFTGAIQVNAGTLKVGDTRGFGNTSGITIVNGGQIDINGKAPGAIYDYTISGVGPDGEGLIINSGAGQFGGAGIKNLILAGDATIGGSERFDIAQGGVITGNGHTLTKIGRADMALRGNASGSPISIVVAGGRLWAENTNDALGSASNALVTVKTGAFVGTYGARTIAVPVMIENGGGLNNLGNGKGIWSGPITVAGDIRLDSDTTDPVATNDIDITGGFSGNANLLKTGSETATLTAPSFVGNTTVLGGKLAITGPASGGYLANGSHVIVATGAFLETTDNGAPDTVASLIVGPASAAAGSDWGGAGSSATNKSDLLSGTGRLAITSAPSATPTFTAWAVNQHHLSGYNALPTADADGDGAVNGIEFVLESDPNSTLSDSLPTVSTDTTHMVFVFRSRSSLQGFVPSVDYGSTLTGWSTAVNGQPEENPISIQTLPNDFGGGVDRVTVRIPKALATGSKIFARLKVSMP